MFQVTKSLKQKIRFLILKWKKTDLLIFYWNYTFIISASLVTRSSSIFRMKVLVRVWTSSSALLQISSEVPSFSQSISSLSRWISTEMWFRRGEKSENSSKKSYLKLIKPDFDSRKDFYSSDSEFSSNDSCQLRTCFADSILLV